MKQHLTNYFEQKKCSKTEQMLALNMYSRGKLLLTILFSTLFTKTMWIYLYIILIVCYEIHWYNLILSTLFKILVQMKQLVCDCSVWETF